MAPRHERSLLLCSLLLASACKDAGTDSTGTGVPSTGDPSTGDPGTSETPATTATSVQPTSGAPTSSGGPATTDADGTSGTTTDPGETTTETSTGTTGGPACDPAVPPPTCDGDLLTADLLKQHEVYIAGTLSEGACYRSVVSHWSTPNDAVGGFDCYFDGDHARIRPTDGRLLYSMVFEGLLREFHCDSCPIQIMDYPDTPLNNDVVLSTPACDPRDTTQMEFLLTPDGGHLYRCTQFENIWYDDEGDVAYESADDPLLHIGRCGIGLTEQAIVDLESGAKTPIDGLPLGAPMTIRTAPEGGFWVVKTPEQPELWHVRPDGVAVSLGVFPQLPPDFQAANGVLDGCGALYQISTGPEVFVDLIVQRTLGGATEVVYSEESDPLVKLHISYLMTGP